MRGYREALRQKYPGVSTGEILKTAFLWEEEYRKDPVGTREKHLTELMRMSPSNFSKLKVQQEDRSLDGSIRRAKQAQQDIESEKEFIEKFGKNYPTVLRQIFEFDRDSHDDPSGVTARLAANYGAPVTQSQIADYEQKHQQHQADHARQEQFKQIASKPIEHRTKEEHFSAVSEAIDRLAGGACNLPGEWNMPGFDRPDVQHAMADALESGSVQRTGVPHVDLRSAYQLVVQNMNWADAENQVRLERGGKSISGGPSANTLPASRGRSNSISDSIRRASGGI